MHEQLNTELAMIVVDTLGSAASFVEENSASEVNRVMNSLRRLSKATGALIVLIDHHGKARETGIRGSSAKLGAADAVWTVTYDEVNWARTLEVTKLRFGKTGLKSNFTLDQIDIDADGSKHCAINWGAAGSEASDKPKPEGNPWRRDKYKPLRRAMDVALTRSGRDVFPYPEDDQQGIKVRAVDMEQVRSEFEAAYPGAGDARRQAWGRIIKSAKADDIVQSHDVLLDHMMWYTREPLCGA